MELYLFEAWLWVSLGFGIFGAIDFGKFFLSRCKLSPALVIPAFFMIIAVGIAHFAIWPLEVWVIVKKKRHADTQY